MRLRVARKVTARHRGTTQLRAVARLGDEPDWMFVYRPRGAKDAITARLATIHGNATFRADYKAQFERELTRPSIWHEAFPEQPGFLSSETQFLVPMELVDAPPLPYSKAKVMELLTAVEETER